MAPLLRKTRLAGLRVEEQLGNIDLFLQQELAEFDHRLAYDGVRLSFLGDVYKFWANHLYSSVNGGGLRDSAKTPGQHYWVGDSTRFLSGRDSINSCEIKISALPSRSRTARGRFRDRSCRAGRVGPETLNHIL